MSRLKERKLTNLNRGDLMDGIFSSFGISDVSDISEIGNGNINKTYHIKSKSGEYILQNINGDVFKNPEAVMKNISEICKIFADSDISVPEYLCADNKNFVFYNGQYWRMYRFIDDCGDFRPKDKNKLYGMTFGRFIRIVNSKKFKPEMTIENFHNFGFYLNRLNSAMSGSSLKKIDSGIIMRLRSLNDSLEHIFSADFPKRIIHGDAKKDNVMLGSIQYVIDLDTVMTGYAALDYGDIVRSVCTEKSIDTADLRSLTKGFAEGLGGILSADEINSLYYGLLWVTGELAVRYMTDWLGKDRYFTAKPPTECLKRANELLSQLNIFVNSGDKITDIIYSAFQI